MLLALTIVPVALSAIIVSASGAAMGKPVAEVAIRAQMAEAAIDARMVEAAISAPAQEPGTILFLGDSLTAGYGLPPEQSFPSLIADRLRELDLPFEVVSAGVPGETSAGGLRRIDWLLRRPVDILVLELGANDMLRGLPLDVTRENLQAIIDKTRAVNPEVKIVVAGMLAPPNLGPEYTEGFREIFPSLAAANDAALIPFLLQDVAARPHLNLPDGIHPNAAGQRIVAEGVWAVLEPILDAERPAASRSRTPSRRGVVPLVAWADRATETSQ